MNIGELDFDDKTHTHKGELEPTLCIDMEDVGQDVSIYTYINKEQALKIVEHLTKVFELSEVPKG